MAQQQQNITVPVDVQQKLQSLSDEYQKLQNNITEAVQSRQRLTAQQTENQSVAKTFTALPKDESQAQIYKLTGPVLLKQERAEAQGVVDGRIEFIGRELERVDRQIEEWEGKSDQRRMEIMRIQSEAQAAQGPEIEA